jgi:hypothetical protein
MLSPYQLLAPNLLTINQIVSNDFRPLPCRNKDKAYYLKKQNKVQKKTEINLIISVFPHWGRF